MRHLVVNLHILNLIFSSSYRNGDAFTSHHQRMALQTWKWWAKTVEKTILRLDRVLFILLQRCSWWKSLWNYPLTFLQVYIYNHTFSCQLQPAVALGNAFTLLPGVVSNLFSGSSPLACYSRANSIRLLSKAWAKKVRNPKTCLLVKNQQFLSYL